MEVPRVVWLDRTPPRRYLDPKRELLVLFPTNDLHLDQRHPHFVELAVSAVGMTNDRGQMTNLPSALPQRRICHLSFCHLSFWNVSVPAESLPARP
jgi:hypothetical protein